MKSNFRVGRNDPCWCGSGLKSKKCHRDRSPQPTVNPFQIEKQLAKNFSKKYCLHPLQNAGQCKGTIVKAHTVQQNGGLSRIALNSHVYAFKPSMALLIENNGRLPPQLIGVSKASTFTGFCSYHDNTTFAPIERQSFQGTAEQCFLLAFRAVCRELFVKRASLDSTALDSQVAKGRAVGGLIEQFVGLFKLALENSLAYVEAQKVKYDRCLLSHTYEDVKYVIIYTENTPGILCSGGFTPHYDFDGNQLQDLMNLRLALDVLVCSIIPTSSGGAVIFTWLDETQGANTRLLRSVLARAREDMGTAIVSLLFEHLENIFWSPLWWSSLHRDTKDYLVDKFGSGVLKYRRPNCLDVGRVRLVNWEIKSIESNTLDGASLATQTGQIFC